MARRPSTRKLPTCLVQRRWPVAGSPAFAVRMALSTSGALSRDAAAGNGYWTATLETAPRPGDGVQVDDDWARGVDSDQESSPGPRGLRFDPVRVLLAGRLLSTVVSDPLVDKASVAVARPGLMCGRGSPSGQWVHRMIARLTVGLRDDASHHRRSALESA